MDLNTVLDFLYTVVEYSSLSLLCLSVALKMRNDMKLRGKIANVKIIYFLLFLGNMMSSLITRILPAALGVSATHLGWNTVLIGVCTTLGFTLIFTLVDWKVLKPLPLFIYAGMILLFLGTGNDIL